MINLLEVVGDLYIKAFFSLAIWITFSDGITLKLDKNNYRMVEGLYKF